MAASVLTVEEANQAVDGLVNIIEVQYRAVGSKLEVGRLMLWPKARALMRDRGFRPEP